MPMTQDPAEIARLQHHYTRLITEMARERLNKVFAENKITPHPTCVDDIRPIPVYEPGTFSLLNLVNTQRRPTELIFPAVEGAFVPAYYKRYRDPVTHKVNHRIVITTDNHCYARFFAAKEMVHCSLDDDGYAATANFEDFERLIGELTEAAATFLTTSAQTIVDQYAWLGAIHYVIPATWIEPLRKLRNSFAEAQPDKKGDADLYIAQLVRVPLEIVRYRLNYTSKL
jgi:hypothetical protein